MEAELELRQTCGACPEQYDVYLGDVEVGYMRLRHGYFMVECNGELVFEGYPDGDGLFEGYEREKFVADGLNAIKAELSA